MIFPLIGDEDHRVRSAVANSLIGMVRTWTDLQYAPEIVRIKRLSRDFGNVTWPLNSPDVAGVFLHVNGLAPSYKDTDRDDDIVANLTLFVDHLFQKLATSNSKFAKVSILNMSPVSVVAIIGHANVFHLIDRWAVSSRWLCLV